MTVEKDGVKGWRRSEPAAADNWLMGAEEQLDKRVSEKRQNIQQVKTTPCPPSIYFTHIHTHGRRKTITKGADKTLIIRSRPLPFLSCLSLFLFQVLSVPINNLSPWAPSAASTIKLLCQTGGGVRGGGRCSLRVSPSHKVLNWASMRTVVSLRHTAGKAPPGQGSC